MLLDRKNIFERAGNPLSNINFQFTMMKLGNFRFALGKGAYSKLEQTREWNWVSHFPMGGKPIVQWGGYKDRTITLEGVIYPGILGSAADVEQMVEQLITPKEKRRGKNEALPPAPKRTVTYPESMPLLMVSGAGRVLGYWRITKCVDTSELLTIDSTPLRLSFTLSLKYHGDSKYRWSGIAQLPASRDDFVRGLL